MIDGLSVCLLDVIVTYQQAYTLIALTNLSVSYEVHVIETKYLFTLLDMDMYMVYKFWSAF